MSQAGSAKAGDGFVVAGAAEPSLVSRRRPARLVTASTAWALVLLAPFLVLLIIFQWAPIGAAIYNSVREFSLVGNSTGWAGLDNYSVIFQNAEFRSSLILTVAFIAAKVVLQVSLGIAVALLVLRKSWLSSLVSSVVFAPTATAIVAVSLMFAFLFDRELGLVNAVLESVGAPRVGWFLEPAAARFVMLAMSLWRDTGFVMLVFLAGLQAVPATLLDAARIDGASWGQELRYVTLPLLIRSFQFAAVFSTLACVRFIAPIDILTHGGPRQSTNVTPFLIYQHAFSDFAWGETSAMSVVLLLLLAVVTASLMSLLRARWEY
jgi:ABC-type sugar transport system permease subunit